MKLAGLVLLLFTPALLWSLSADQLAAFRQASLEECNWARTNPQEYARHRLAEAYRSGTDNGAYKELMQLAPRAPLKLDPKLVAAAQDFSVFLSRSKIFDHDADGKDPFLRIEAKGFSWRAAGENIAAGQYDEPDAARNPKEAAIAFVLDWIIDDGVDDVGHRENILSDEFTLVGVGYAYNSNSEYGSYGVQDFGTPR